MDVASGVAAVIPLEEFHLHLPEDTRWHRHCSEEFPPYPDRYSNVAQTSLRHWRDIELFNEIGLNERGRESSWTLDSSPLGQMCSSAIEIVEMLSSIWRWQVLIILFTLKEERWKRLKPLSLWSLFHRISLRRWWISSSSSQCSWSKKICLDKIFIRMKPFLPCRIVFFDLFERSDPVDRGYGSSASGTWRRLDGESFHQWLDEMLGHRIPWTHSECQRSIEMTKWSTVLSPRWHFRSISLKKIFVHQSFPGCRDTDRSVAQVRRMAKDKWFVWCLAMVVADERHRREEGMERGMRDEMPLIDRSKMIEERPKRKENLQSLFIHRWSVCLVVIEVKRTFCWGKSSSTSWTRANLSLSPLLTLSFLLCGRAMFDQGLSSPMNLLIGDRWLIFPERERTIRLERRFATVNRWRIFVWSTRNFSFGRMLFFPDWTFFVADHWVARLRVELNVSNIEDRMKMLV